MNVEDFRESLLTHFDHFTRTLRRMNCLGVLLLPITLNMAGVGPGVARLLGLLP